MVPVVPAHYVLNGLVARQTIDPSNLPSACQSSCQVVNTMTVSLYLVSRASS